MLCAWLTLLLWVPGFVGLGLGITVWVLADRDLAAMRSGLKDPAGRRDTQEARAYAIPAVGISVAALLLCTPFLWEVVRFLLSPRKP
jgi:hypothetical protein